MISKLELDSLQRSKISKIAMIHSVTLSVIQRVLHTERLNLNGIDPLKYVQFASQF